MGKPILTEILPGRNAAYHLQFDVEASPADGHAVLQCNHICTAPSAGA